MSTTSPRRNDRGAVAVMVALLAVLLLSPERSAAAASTGTAIEKSRPARLAPRSLLLDGAARGGLVVAVGERGHILLSSDAGASWRQAEVESRALLTGIHGLACATPQKVRSTSGS